MTTDLLRAALHYPDDDLDAPDLATVEMRARSIRRRRRSALLAAGAMTVATVAAGSFTAASVGSFGGAPRALTRVQPGAGPAGTDSPSSLSAASPASTAPAPVQAAPTVTAAVGERVDMGFGWKVWLRDGEVCRSAPAESGGGTFEPFGCRSITDGNIGGVNLQSSGSSDGSMLSGLIPYDAARVSLRTGDTVTDAALVRFEHVKGWTFYYRWVPGPPASTQVTAYDGRGRVLGRMG